MSQMASKPPEVGRGKEGFPYRFQREHGLADTLIWTSSLQSCETMNFCYFKPPHFSYLVMAALGNQYRVQEEGKPQVSPLPYWLMTPLWRLENAPLRSPTAVSAVCCWPQGHAFLLQWLSPGGVLGTLLGSFDSRTSSFISLTSSVSRERGWGVCDGGSGHLNLSDAGDLPKKLEHFAIELRTCMTKNSEKLEAICGAGDLWSCRGCPAAGWASRSVTACGGCSGASFRAQRRLLPFSSFHTSHWPLLSPYPRSTQGRGFY